MRDADQKTLERLARAVADRERVDWEHAVEGSEAPLQAPVRHLRLVQQIDEFHREGAETEAPAAITVPSDPPSPPASLRTWGPLELRGTLGRGHAGQVFRAYDPALKTEVALKLFDRPDASLDEARRLARVRHPNVVTVHGVAVHDGRAGLWTELLEGRTLEAAVTQDGAFGAQEAALIGIDLCRALSAVHRAGLVHRDVKTSNVVRERGGRIVLLDFSVGSERHETLASSIVGTPLFMAPELFSGRDSGVASDIYSLGVTLYRLVTGKYPVEAEDSVTLAEAHHVGKRTRLVDARSDLPPAFVEVVERALSRDPGDRYSSAGEMERALAGVVGTVSSPERDTAGFGRRFSLVAAIGGVILVGSWAVYRMLAPLEVEARWLRIDQGIAEALDNGSVISPGDCLELDVRGSRGMHLYVLNEDAVGSATVLYPSPAVAVANPLPGRRTHRLPGPSAGGSECWPLGAGGGEERMLVVASTRPLPQLESQLADLPRASRNRGVTGLAPSPRPPDRSRIAEVVDLFEAGDGGGGEVWMWQVRFVDRSERSEVEAARPALDAWEMTAALRGTEAGAMSNLADSLLAGADEPDNFFAAVQGLELASRAVELDAESFDACVSRARGLDRVFLEDEALEEWNRCLGLESNAAGRAMVLEHLARPPRPDAVEAWESAKDRLTADALDDVELRRLVKQYPNETYSLVETELLPRWGRQVLDGEEEKAEATLERVRMIGALLVESIGDALVADVVTNIAVMRGGEKHERHTVARGLVAHAAAITAERSGQFETMRTQVAHADKAFGEGDNPYRLLSRYQQAVSTYQRQAYGDTLAYLEQIRAVASASRYRSLLARTLWMEGLTMGRQARLSSALETYGAACREYDALGDLSSSTAVHALIATAFDSLGEFDEGWRHRHSAARNVPEDPEPSTRSRVLSWMATAAHRQRLPHVALMCQLSGLKLATPIEEPLTQITSRLRLAMMQHELGNLDSAFAQLAEGRSYLAQLESTDRVEIEAQLAAAEARIVADTDPRRAARCLDEAIEFYERSDQVTLAQMLSMRGRANMATGSTARAESDLLGAIGFLERHRPDSQTAASHIGYADIVRDVYDSMALLQLANQRPDVALVYAERGRGQLLRRTAADGSWRVEAVAELSSRIPDGVALLYYVVVDDRLVAWAVTSQGLEHFDRSIDEYALRDEIRGLREGALEPAARLYDVLVRPLMASIGSVRTIIVVPDKLLQLVPFGALRDRDRQRYLVQDFNVAVSPSASVYLIGAAQRSAGTPPTSVLAVADPSFETSLYPSLGRLNGARSEAKAIAQLYPEGTILVGEQATVAAFLSGLANHDVIHFAGHALASRSDAVEGRLLLAPDHAGGSGDLLSDEIYRQRDVNTKLVVLAACETAAGRISSSEGPLSLARPFLAAGAAAVVANLWPIEDSAASVLFSRFHEEYLKSDDVAKALRAAQVTMIESGNRALANPRHWAASQVYLGAGINGASFTSRRSTQD